jgi:DHA2 family multidrug resistance protein
LLFWFRFTLTGTIILIPQSLAIHGFEANQIGPAIIWSAAPLLLIALTAGLLMLGKLDPRLVLAAGLSCTAFAVLLNSEYTTAWSAANYYRTELLTGVGQAISLIGLVGCIILQGVFTGGLAKPQWILTFSAFFHTIRLFGGQAGAIYMAHFLDQREKLHSNLLGLHVTSGSWITDANLHGMAAGVYAKSSGLAAAGARAVDLIGARLRLQAYALSLNDGFVLVAWSCVVGLLLTALLRKSPLNYGDLPAFQQPSSEPKESNS